MTVHVSQRDLWNNWHTRTIARDPEPFHHEFRAQFLCEVIHREISSRVLELGCGQGMDSTYFAEAGCDVEALDFSSVAVERARTLAAEAGRKVNFLCRDISRPLPYEDCVFGGVFSYLSLHYFDSGATARIVREVYRVLVPRGVFALSVRSTDDPLFGVGLDLGDNMFSNKGHVRHFFSMKDVRSLLERWDVTDIGQRAVNYLDDRRPPGVIVHAVATKLVEAERGESE